MAHHLIDSTDQRGLEALARFARMTLGRGGRLYADLDVLRPGEHYRPDGPRDAVRPKDADRVVRTLEESGAVIVLTTRLEESAQPGLDEPVRPVLRLVAEWRK
jgi:hypothetical protein